MDISYKAAWEIVDAINNLADKPLVVRITGGRGGGGTHLTREGAEVIDNFRTIQKEHEIFLEKIAVKMDDAKKFYEFIHRIALKVSAKNLLKGTITKIIKGAVSAEIDLSIRGSDTVIAIITNESVEFLDLRVGKDVYAIVKASSVLVVKEMNTSKISARNKLFGKVVKISEGAVNAEVTLELPGRNTVCAVISCESLHEIGICEGDCVFAIFKGLDVLVGVV